MRFRVTVTFPGTAWASISDTVEFRDQERVERGEAARTAISQVEGFAKTQERRYRKYGATVEWRAVDE